MAFPQFEVLNTTKAVDWTAGVSGASSDNIMELTFADSTTPASGYSHGIHIGYTKSGTDTGSGCSVMQFNGYGIDYTISGGTSGAGFYAFYAYVAKSGSPTLTNAAIFGANLEMNEMGATDYFGGLWLNKYNTTLGTSIDAFILMSNQSTGVTRTCFYVQGTRPTYFLQMASNAAADMLSDWSAGTTVTKRLALYFGTTTLYLHCFTS